MDRGLVIPRYRPDLGIGKSYVDYDLLDNPTVDTTMSTSFSAKSGDLPSRVTAPSERVNYSRKRETSRRTSSDSRERFGSEEPATCVQKFNSNPLYEGQVSQKEKRRSPSSEREMSDPFSFEAINERLKPLLMMTQQCGHEFTIKSPRYNDPSALIESKHHSKSQASSAIESSRLDNESRYANNRISAIKKRNSNDDPFVDLENSDHVDTDHHSYGMRDAHKGSHRIPTNSKQEIDDASEDTIKDPLRSPSGLQQRTQQAWKVHRQKNSNLRTKMDPKAPRSTNTVSFNGKDSVQYFEPHIEELTDDITEENTDEPGDDVTDMTEETGASFDDRSLNSEYTKGLESEVEDIIKDIFFIGNAATSKPGRRKIKYKHDVKKRLREKGIVSSKPNVSDTKDRSMETQTTAQSNDTDADADRDKKKVGNVMSKQQSQKGSKPNRSETQASKVLPEMSEAEAALWNFVEGSVTAVSSALGFNGEGAATTSLQQSQGEQFLLGNTCSGPILPFEPCPGRTTSSIPADFFEFYDYPRDVAYSPLRETKFKQVIAESDFDDREKDQSKSSSSTEDLALDEADEATEEQLETRNLPFSVEDLDNNPELMELAQHAARSLHQSQGVEYDESNVISMHNDLQISVVELKLPLGLVFLENDGGCFVTKVSPEGSAARSGGVEVGDQLAYINGKSSVRMNVDDICKVIAKAHNPNCIELVLFRYVGPLRPATKPMRSLPVYDDAEITVHSPETYGNRSTFQLVSAYPPKEYVPKKKGFRFFGRTRLPIPRK